MTEALRSFAARAHPYLEATTLVGQRGIPARSTAASTVDAAEGPQDATMEHGALCRCVPDVYPGPNGSRAPSGRETSKAKTTAEIIW
jgi:hypothetical protein